MRSDERRPPAISEVIRGMVSAKRRQARREQNNEAWMRRHADRVREAATLRIQLRVDSYVSCYPDTLVPVRVGYDLHQLFDYWTLPVHWQNRFVEVAAFDPEWHAHPDKIVDEVIERALCDISDGIDDRVEAARMAIEAQEHFDSMSDGR